MAAFLNKINNTNKSINLDKFFEYVFRSCVDKFFNDYLNSSIYLFNTFTDFEEQKQDSILAFLATCFPGKTIHINSLKKILEIPLDKLQDTEFQTICRRLSTYDIFKGPLIHFNEGNPINPIDETFGEILLQRSSLQPLNSESLELFENLTQALNIKEKCDCYTHLKKILFKMKVEGINRTVWNEIIQTIRSSYSDTSIDNKTNIIQYLDVFLSLDQSIQTALYNSYKSEKQRRQDLDFIIFLRSKQSAVSSGPPQPSGSSRPPQSAATPGSSQPAGPPRVKITSETLTQDILNQPNFGAFLQKLIELRQKYQKEPDLFWLTFYNVIRFKLKTYLEKSRDDKPIINSDRTYKLIEKVKSEFSTFISALRQLSYVGALPSDQTQCIDYILSENKATEDRFEIFCQNSRRKDQKDLDSEMNQTLSQEIRQHRVQISRILLQIPKIISDRFHFLNLNMHTDSLFYLKLLINFKSLNESFMLRPVLQFQYQITLFTGIRTLIRACIKSETDGKLSKDAANNYIFKEESLKDYLLEAMKTLNNLDIFGEKQTTLEKFIDYIFSEEPSQSFIQFITDRCQGRDILSKFQEINEKLKKDTPLTIDDQNFLKIFLHVNSFSDFLEIQSTNKYDTVPFVKELLAQGNELKQLNKQYRSRKVGVPPQRVGN